jgi:hypothetical protein
LQGFSRGEEDEVARVLRGAQGVRVDFDEEESAQGRPEDEPGGAVIVDEEVGVDGVVPDVVDAADDGDALDEGFRAQDEAVVDPLVFGIAMPALQVPPMWLW